MLVSLATAVTWATASPQNMNPDVAYTIANPAKPGTEFGFRGKFFELTTRPFQTRYSEVFWDNLPAVPLPQEIVAEFDGKIMAVTGFEFDILRNTSDGKVEHVPCYESYNHHYAQMIIGKGADGTAKNFDPEAPVQNSHGGPRWVAIPNGKDSGSGFSTQSFNEHNGNEARQTYHGMPNGYVVPIESPQTWHMTPMQINTRNPDGSGTRCNDDCPLPRKQNAWKGAPWSGILECPCSTRATKYFMYEMRATNDGGCTYNSSLTSSSECFENAAKASKKIITLNSTVTDATKPHGCFVQNTEAIFNTAPQNVSAKCDSFVQGGCICRGMNGWIDHGSGKQPFQPNCMGEPKSDLLATHNPTCDINQYDGGLRCCENGFSLLDADQSIPPLVDNVFFKSRWYYEEYQPATSKPTYHLEWQFGHIEYSVPKAEEGTPADKATHTLTTRFTVGDLLSMGNANAGGYGWDLSNTSRKIEIIMLGFHCHSPACISGELRNADTNEVLCTVTPVVGNSTVAHLEEDYIWLPPCQFGNPADGFLAPPVLSMDTNLTSVKIANSSVAHSGVMAIWQGRGAYAD